MGPSIVRKSGRESDPPGKTLRLHIAGSAVTQGVMTWVQRFESGSIILVIGIPSRMHATVAGCNLREN